VNDYEFAVANAVLSRGEHAAEVSEYEAARRAFEEAEARCDEVRGPYEKAIREAQRNYESKRQEYVKIVEEVREELEKAPEAYRQRYDEILGKREKRWSPPAGCTSSARSATRAGASTTNCAGDPGGRAIRALRDFIYRSKTTSCASSAPSGFKAS
jgi:hypothetical protein